MKNKRKKILLCSVLTVIICLALGYIMHKNKRDSYIETQEKRIDLYFKYNLKKYDSLKIVKVEKNPMGGYFIDGYVNHNKDYYFTAYASHEDNFQFNGDISYDPKTLKKLFKEKDPKYKWDPNQIIKKEHLDKSKYEVDPPLFFIF
ncbi:DUF1433 domain-containing protein [Staphylococcus caprae]|uniref:DUF1433 domain-containing protein n=1 Tax=Staphylococcus caprae TaxID=29380 RepID=UPI001C111859|nr:DUF1433 domain-containing protein [Staphylococcus caprae]MBU5271320.1 DUF1433 domain-containing protein [Staphylococcus caprae]MDK6297043.1 DUF1433 domain-containing protein [Staphylococcus caprae]MDK7232831.1 DUF1433 domain-containing protein [Staphylococcus caprae]